MSRRKRRGRRRRDEHVDPVQSFLRATAVRRELQTGGSQIGEHHDGRHGERNARTAQYHGSDDTECDPQQPVRSRVGEAGEKRIEPVDAMLDDPALEALVE
jgi:hypothetical protein